MIRGGGVDGLILQGAGEISDTLIAGAVRKAVPIVLLQADMDINAHLGCLPDKEAALLATDHLRDLGHRRIGCLATEAGLTFTDARLSGWLKAMGTDADDALIVHAPPNVTQGELGMQELLERRSDITAVVCFNVVSAVGALRQIKSAGLRVPDNLSVIAIHDLQFAPDLSIPLTVVAMPLSEMGELAVKSICVPQPSPRACTILSQRPELIVRKSAAPPVAT